MLTMEDRILQKATRRQDPHQSNVICEIKILKIINGLAATEDIFCINLNRD